MKHTEGKWMVAKAGITKFEVVADKPNTKIHPGVGIKAEEVTLIAQIEIIQDVKNVCWEEQEANAKLIASAPELLENIESLVDRIEENKLENHFFYAYRRAKEAIKKATS